MSKQNKTRANEMSDCLFVLLDWFEELGKQVILKGEYLFRYLPFVMGKNVLVE